ncbi:unnamed protein product [Cuscuta europaea]|uniref:SWIM-type domain-containing protein n=1 Tax=Cuscuta europaea TaxID=41803 RepID=A0A9P0YM66_CUSEU|nr:unnamed protein product [Cuscuta europaea]
MKLHHKSYTPRDIIAIAWSRWTININYWKAWHARLLALEHVHGNYEKSYAQVPELCRQIEASNPDSLVAWKFDTENRCKYLCVAFRASLDGWKKGCRPLIGLDGCFLKGKYIGVCLAAIRMDGNNGMFPLAVFICRKDDGENWDKFLELIAPKLKKHSLPLTVISDRAQAIISSIETHLEGCNPRSCFRHIFKNISKWWKRDHIKRLAWATATAYKKIHFERNLVNLENAAVGSKDYLMGIGPHLWSRAHFDTIYKSDHLTNNFTESYNSFILSEREKPVCSMIIGMSFLMMKIMYDRKLESSTWDESGVVPRVFKTLTLYKVKQNDFVTHPSGEGTFCVRNYTGQHWTLNLNNHECECCEWQVKGLPCVHAVHLISHLRLPLTHLFLSVKAYRSSYESNIKPISHESDWPEGNEIVLPPTLSRAPRTPKHNRIKGHDENETQARNMKKCSKCLAFGRNKRSCQGGPIKGGADTSSGATGSTRASKRGGGRATGKGVGRVIGRGVGRGASGRGVGRAGAGRGVGRAAGR